MEKNTSREPRELTLRDLSKRREKYTESTDLPVPNPENGYGFRWIRTYFGGRDDAQNVQKKLVEGWEVVLADDHPELQAFECRQGFHKGCLEFGGLLLMKIPTEFARTRDAKVHAMANGQMQSLEQSFLRERDNRSNMKLFSEQSVKTSFGRG
jgi:hypothetical protein